MKVFQIVDGFCRWDATKKHPTLASTVGLYPKGTEFVEAPDFVFEGWGYVNGEFIQPVPPDGWTYDESTGTFKDLNIKPVESLEERVAKLEEEIKKWKPVQ